MSDLFQEQLQALRARAPNRKLREIGSAQGAKIDLVGRQLVNFSSNDYLGLANDALLREAAIAAVAEFGVGAGASRVFSGTQSPHVRLESALAKWKGTSSALAFSSGSAAAIGTIPTLIGKQDVAIIDKLCHPSLIDGAKLSGATVRVFPHNHLGKLESQLASARNEHPGARVLMIAESVSSLDGDRAPLREIVGLKKRYGAMLLLDEAHAIGVIGANGRGLAAEENLMREIDVQIGSLGKALGVSGGFVCGSRSLIEWLMHRARSFTSSTAPPPALAAAATAAVKFLDSEAGEHRRVLLWQRIGVLRRWLGFNPLSAPPITSTGSAIHPIHVGDEQAAIDLSRSLEAEGFLTPAIVYPMAAKSSARLRISVTAAHEEPQIRRLVESLRRLRAELTAAA